MKKILFSILIMSAMLFTGCFSTEKDENVNQSGDVIGAILEVAYSKSVNVKATAAEVPNVSNGVVSGVYLKLGTGMYTYSFPSIAVLDGEDKSDFLIKWNSATDAESYIVYGNKAIDLITAKAKITAHSSLGAELSTNGVDSSAGGFAIQPSTLIAVYPDAVTDPKVRADRKVVVTGVAHTSPNKARVFSGTTFKNATVTFSEGGSSWSATADALGVFTCTAGDPQGNSVETVNVKAVRAGIPDTPSKTFYLYSMRMSYDIGLGNAMYFTGSLPELTSWGIGIPGTWTTGNIWIASFISDTTQNFTWKTRKNAGGTWEIDPNHDQSNLSPAFNGGY